ncbi:nucleolar protein 4-like [Liolophura sinensis]|uniref:nucleolar protein 4-like n=1 Tax=Liolophura sinensis TaxID=3198878 RepID=UPI0031584ED7
MFQTFQSWALRNYGDSGKTKTVTRRKYERIIKILNGEEQSTAENSKFRFWVKAKGFRVGGDREDGTMGFLHVPTRGHGDGIGLDKGFKRVAIVEDFFDIIYNVHVEMDGRGGKHAGQKRTYRAIAETYAFLPREAVTRFLMSCSDCQKRMHLTSESINNNNNIPVTAMSDDSPAIDFSLPITQTYLTRMCINDNNEVRGYERLQVRGYERLQVRGCERLQVRGCERLQVRGCERLQVRGYERLQVRGCERLQVRGCERLHVRGCERLQVRGYERLQVRGYERLQVRGYERLQVRGFGSLDPNVTRTDKQGIRGVQASGACTDSDRMSKRGAKHSKGKAEDSMSSEESEVSRDRSVSPHTETTSSPSNGPKTEGADETTTSPLNMATGTKCARLEEGVAAEKPVPAPLITPSSEPSNASPVKVEEPVVERLPTERIERKRRASDELSMDSSTKASESGNLDELQAVRDDDEDDDNDDDDKVLPGQDIDPERLKAFNMFVRLFVDENLDRMVPISKQPKDKIQAILEACDRQFPEFHERARKRIRTYLKSCRRMRRSKEQNGWEPLRPTPPHLTSAAAEGILAQACENESNNAKRMRMGLDPLPAAAMHNRGTTSSSATAQPSQTAPPPPPPPPVSHGQSQPAAEPIDRPIPPVTDFLRHTPATFRPPHDFHPPFFANGNGLFRPGFPTGYQPPAHHHPQLLQHQTLQHTQVQNGKWPTDLSLKKQNSKNQLSPSEVATIKQLIAGYRESAAFLYRSADELEQLLLQQN